MMNPEMILNRMKRWSAYLADYQLARQQAQDFTVNTKQKVSDYVTDVDLYCEDFLIQQIEQEFPGHAILSEERGTLSGESDYQWIIDPLDGTTNFIHGLPFFSISLLVEKKREPFIALIAFPSMDQQYSAIAGRGAYCNGLPIAVSDVHQWERSLLGTGFPLESTLDTKQTALLNQFMFRSAGIRRFGSAALDLCYVASGKLEGFWEFNLNPWDYKAGALIVQEAGGSVSFGDYGKTSWLCAGNENLAPEICQTINKELV